LRNEVGKVNGRVEPDIAVRDQKVTPIEPGVKCANRSGGAERLGCLDREMGSITDMRLDLRREVMRVDGGR
jgi:hypothetical protein